MTREQDLHRSIAALLQSRSASKAIIKELEDRYADWQTRAVIAELRERRAQDRYDRKLARLFPSALSEKPVRH